MHTEPKKCKCGILNDKKGIIYDKKTHKINSRAYSLKYSDNLLFRSKFPLNPWSAKIFLYQPKDQRFFFQFEITRNVLVTSFWFIWIPMLWVYGDYKCFIFSVRDRLYTRRRILTYKDDSALEGLIPELFQYQTYSKFDLTELVWTFGPSMIFHLRPMTEWLSLSHDDHCRHSVVI